MGIPSEGFFFCQCYNANMSKRVIIVHGWGDSPNGAWFPWLKSELEQRGFEVHIPSMPNPDYPKIESWVGKMRTLSEKPGPDTILVGHSIGCQTILRFLEMFQPTPRIAGAVFVAPWLTLKSLDSAEDEATAKPWLTRPINFSGVKSRVPKIIAIFSDNDPYVPFENEGKFKQLLGAETMMLHDRKHFADDEGTMELPEALNAVLEMAK
jgi:hypothetical protein